MFSAIGKQVEDKSVHIALPQNSRQLKITLYCLEVCKICKRNVSERRLITISESP